MHSQKAMQILPGELKIFLQTFETLTANQIKKIYQTYKENPQNRSSFKGMDYLCPLLNKWSDTPWIINEGEIVPETEVRKNKQEEEAPPF